MTKAELIDKIAAKADISKKAANVTLNTFVDSVTSALKKGDRVSLVGFGTFSVAKRKARIARNPRTGEKINVPARKAPKFKAGRELKNALR
ncbi:DNA-binding protein HU-beta [subsurface metagenome]|jgi:DNA-binding protein HU-beta